MKTYKLYLAGPIAGCSYDQATDWREQARQMMQAAINCYSPMRGKEFLQGGQKIGSSAYEGTAIATAHGIMGRDHNDVRTADAVLMNLLGAKRISIGSMIEAAWCYAYRIPLILVMESDGSNIHEHVMLAEIPVYRASKLPEGCALVQHLLLP